MQYLCNIESSYHSACIIFIVLLSWFVDKPVAEAGFTSALIDEDKVECAPKRIPNGIMDKNMDIYLV